MPNTSTTTSSLYPAYPFGSRVHEQRGCRLSGRFCAVPRMEGRPRAVNTVWDIWREVTTKAVCLLVYNDFFGQEPWRERIGEILEGGFRVAPNQGVNMRMITDEVAQALASVEYRDDGFERRRLYTVWDNLG